ncbi:DUF3040 domain-containing protein [Rhodococcus sp. NPDC058505]|uniref:DUF3040 domain-containing protein n=1 Tax=unclassified Rhodococcus (in: high G+C Gram-positive bacteria) TaxID=192944 RepID=UPI00364C0285
MPLSEHEQRMLDQIESALYAEDPKFASSVRGGRMHAASSKSRMQAGALFVLGLVLLVAGIPLATIVGNVFLIVSLLGFLVMFGAGVLFLRGSGPGVKAGSGEKSGPTSATGKPSGGRRSGGGFSSRMEDRFKKRFEQE